MSEPLHIWLAGTVRGKGRPRFVRSTGRAYTPAQTVNYEAALRMAGQEAMKGRAPLKGPLQVQMAAVFAIPQSMSKKDRALVLTGALWPTKKPDLDNIMKLSDALNQVVWEDDKQIVRAILHKKYGDVPSLGIIVTEL